MKIRHFTEWENEVPTLFEFVMLFAKLWKIGCQKSVKKFFVSTHRFLCEVEAAAYDFCKSAIIDAHVLRIKPSFLVAALFSSSIEIVIKLNKGEADPKGSPILSQVVLCNKAWDNILASLFGRDNKVDELGRYLVYRQQVLFKAFEGQLSNIYKSRCKPFYNHNFFGVVKLSKGSGKKDADTFDIRVQKDRRDTQ